MLWNARVSISQNEVYTVEQIWQEHHISSNIANRWKGLGLMCENIRTWCQEYNQKVVILCRLSLSS